MFGQRFALVDLVVSNYVSAMKRWIPFVKSPPTVSVVRLAGIISANPRGGGLSDQSVAPLLERAFSRGKPQAVALAVNSPGGSPAQSSLIGARIRRLAEDKGIPVVAFVEDVAASGGYWLASAADEIWADETSILGSIGVISAGFGLDNMISRIGVERRVHTAGRSKSMLDPFRPENPEDVDRLQGILGDLHASFIGHVQARRGAKLAAADGMFEGEFWTGKRAVELGLADGIGHLVPHMKDRFGDKVRFRVYGPRRGLLQRFGMRLAADASLFVEERAAYARFGL